MPEANTTWRVNRESMKWCCVMALEYEMYRRCKNKQALMSAGDTIRCEKCDTEMICDPSQNDGRLRWRVK